MVAAKIQETAEAMMRQEQINDPQQYDLVLEQPVKEAPAPIQEAPEPPPVRSPVNVIHPDFQRWKALSE
jgi:hypothetical protein